MSGEGAEVEGERLLPAAPAAESGTARPPSSTLRTLLDTLRKEPLLARTLLGVLAGILLGTVVHSATGSRLRSPEFYRLLGLPGALFMNALKCMVIPLITGSAFAGVLSLQRDAAKASRAIARRTLSLYLVSMLCAVTIGIVCMSVFQPGRGVTLSDACGAPPSAVPPPPVAHLTGTQALLNTVLSCIPPNIFAALASSNVLGLIVFSIATAIAVSHEGPSSVEAALGAANRFNSVVSRLVNAILYCTPVCICSLLASQVAATCHPLKLLSSLAYFIAVYTLGLVLHAAVLIPTALTLVARVSPREVFRGMLPALATVFATDSSSATLPVTLMCCKERLKLPASIVDFVIPLGTTGAPLRTGPGRASTRSHSLRRSFSLAQ